MTTEIGLFYGSTTGMTEDVAFRLEALVREQFPDVEITAINIIDLEDPRDMVIDKIADVDLHGKRIALFGLGDQVGYPEYYLDALGMIAEQLRAQGAQFVGEWPTAGYKFERSKALLPNGNFIGLALDEDSQPELTDERLKTWLGQLIPLLLTA